MSVRAGSLRVGRRGIISVAIRRGGTALAGVGVVATGAGTTAKARTNRNGVARLRVKPRRVGVITIRVLRQPARCGASRRVGVTRELPILTG